MRTLGFLVAAICWASVASRATKKSLDGKTVHLERLVDDTVKRDSLKNLDSVMRINLRSEDGQLVKFNLVKNMKLTRSIPIEVDDGKDITIDDVEDDIDDETSVDDSDDKRSNLLKKLFHDGNEDAGLELLAKWLRRTLDEKDESPRSAEKPFGPRNKKFHERNMFYHDMNKHAVVGLTDHGHKITMRASFLHNGDLYQVEPVVGHPTAHKITRDEIPTGYDFRRREAPVIDINAVPVDNSTEDGNLRKRALPDDFKHPSAYNVELYMITDKSYYDYVQANLATATTESETLEAIYFRLSFILNGMDLAYRKIERFNIDVWVKKMYISTSSSTSPWTENNKLTLSDGTPVVEMNKCLAEVGTWATETKGYKWYEYDHFMMFTAYDIGEVEDGVWSSGTLGLAYTENVCIPKYASSINEDTGFKTWMTASHELGHNLGAPHDGSGSQDAGISDCQADALHIMTPYATRPGVDFLENVATFSYCSEFYMHENIYGNNRYSQPKTCLYNAACENEASYIEWGDHAEDLPGQRWDLDTQCAIANDGTSFTSYYENGYDDINFPEICYQLKCINGTHFRTGAGAADGTFCDYFETKWCSLSKCVDISSDDSHTQGGHDYDVTDSDFACGSTPSLSPSCRDRNIRINLDGEIVKCSDIAEYYPEICPQVAGKGGICCASCGEKYFIPA